MELFEARAWLVVEKGVFRKPCAFIRGKHFISQPFFSKTIGRVTAAFVAKNFSLEYDEIAFLLSALELSGLPEETDCYDAVVMKLNRSTDVLERLTKSFAKEAMRKMKDGTIAEMYKPLGAYFDAFDCLDGVNHSEPPPPRTKGGQFIH